MTIKKWFVAFLLAVCSSLASAACTVTDQVINFGVVAFSAPVGTIALPVTVTVNCSAGENYTLKPNASSSGNITIQMTREGVANGNSYMYFLNTSGVLMRSGNPASLITGVGTGGNQTYNLTAVLSGSTVAGSLVVINKTGTFNSTAKLFQLTSTTTVTSGNQQVTGDVEGQCTISSGNMAYGTIQALGIAQNIVASTNINVQCDTNLVYIMMPDSTSTRWIYNSGMSLDVANPPRPADPALFRIDIRPLGGGAASWAQWGPSSNTKTSAGTGALQTWEVRGTLSLSANWQGDINATIYPKIIF